MLNVPCKRSCCTVELCPAWPMWNHVKQRLAGHSSPSSRATKDSVYLQFSRGMDLDRAHQVDSWAAQCRICGYRIVYIHVVLCFSSRNTVSWSTPQMVYPHSTDCCYLLGWLTTPWNKKNSTCPHHIFLGCAANNNKFKDQWCNLYVVLYNSICGKLSGEIGEMITGQGAN